MGFAVIAGGAPAGAAADSTIPLPTAVDGLLFSPNAQQLVLGSGTIERRLPGPVTDRETVSVGVGTGGAPVAVEDVQRLTLRGVGDFFFHVPGPARSVRALPTSEDPPGLRQGAIVWQGFSPGHKELDARATLDPLQERARLPVALELRTTVAGRQVTTGATASGPLSVSLTITNATASRVALRRGDVDAGSIARGLDAARADLARGKRPQPGRDGVPFELRARGPVTTVPEPLDVAMRVRGELEVTAGSLTGVVVRGGRAQVSSTTVRVAFDVTIGGGRPPGAVITVTGSAQEARTPSLALTAAPALPAASTLVPPGAATWAHAVLAGSAPPAAQMLDRLLRTLWRSARISQYEQYLGNPDPIGPSTTTYSYATSAPVRAPPAVTARPVSHADPLGVLALIGVAVALAALAVVGWSRS